MRGRFSELNSSCRPATELSCTPVDRKTPQQRGLRQNRLGRGLQGTSTWCREARGRTGNAYGIDSTTTTTKETKTRRRRTTTTSSSSSSSCLHTHPAFSPSHLHVRPSLLPAPLFCFALTSYYPPLALSLSPSPYRIRRASVLHPLRPPCAPTTYVGGLQLRSLGEAARHCLSHVFLLLRPFEVRGGVGLLSAGAVERSPGVSGLSWAVFGPLGALSARLGGKSQGGRAEAQTMWHSGVWGSERLLRSED